MCNDKGFQTIQVAQHLPLLNHSKIGIKMISVSREEEIKTFDIIKWVKYRYTYFLNYGYLILNGLYYFE